MEPENKPDCIFCKIARKEIASNTVLENDRVLAFLDIHPVNPGHTLVIAKTHSEDFTTMGPVDAQAVIDASQHITRALFTLGYDGVNVHINVKPAAGQVIEHTHFHIVPRQSDDGLKHWPGKAYAAGDDKVWLEKLRSSLR